MIYYKVHLVDRPSQAPVQDGDVALCGKVFKHKQNRDDRECWDDIESYVLADYRATPDTYDYCLTCITVVEVKRPLLTLGCIDL